MHTFFVTEEKKLFYVFFFMWELKGAAQAVPNKGIRICVNDTSVFGMGEEGVSNTG